MDRTFLIDGVRRTFPPVSRKFTLLVSRGCGCKQLRPTQSKPVNIRKNGKSSPVRWRVERKNLLMGWNRRTSEHPDQHISKSRHMRDLKATVLATAKAPILGGEKHWCEH